MLRQDDAMPSALLMVWDMILQITVADADISPGSRPKKQSFMSPHGLLRAEVHGERLSSKGIGGVIGLFRTFYTVFITAIIIHVV